MTTNRCAVAPSARRAGPPPILFLTWTLAVFLALPADGRSAEANTAVIHIGTLPGLRYDTATFFVRPGASVELVFSNQDEMPHNLVITTPAARLEIVTAALALGAAGPDKHFVPDSPKVLAATPVVAARESATLRFTAPAQEGDYPFVCTYPGHGFIMFGTMTVTREPKPPVRNKPDAPGAAHDAHHPPPSADRARLIRTFMPDAGPACIAVGLPGDYSYCWDAGAVRFRYAWKGGYVTEVYRKPHRIDGDIFYVEGDGFPLRAGATPEAVPRRVQFRGYGLDPMGIPEFEYEFDGVSVRERIELRAGNLVRRFRTEGDAGTLWFAIPSDKESQLSATGVKAGGFFKFEGKDAREFYITIKPEPN